MILPLRYFLVIFLICIGIGFYSSTITSNKYNWPIDVSRDTVFVSDTIKDTIPVKADTVYNIPNEFTTNISNISLDTITTIINGSAVNTNIKISIVDINKIQK